MSWHAGSEGLDKFFTPKQLTRGENAVFEHSLSNGLGNSPHPSSRTIVTLLDKELEDTESKCAALIANIGESKDSSQLLDRAKELGQQIESLHSLLKQLKTQG